MQTQAHQTGQITSTRFGDVSYDANDVIEFPWGLPGFAHVRRFVPLAYDDKPEFIWLQCLDDAAIALPTANPWLLFDDYDPNLPAYAVAALDIQRPTDFTVVCVVVVTKDAEEMTMNLLAPIVINLRLRRARQVMLENSNYSVKAPIPRKGATVDT